MTRSGGRSRSPGPCRSPPPQAACPGTALPGSRSPAAPARHCRSGTRRPGSWPPGPAAAPGLDRAPGPAPSASVTSRENATQPATSGISVMSRENGLEPPPPARAIANAVADRRRQLGAGAVLGGEPRQLEPVPGQLLPVIGVDEIGPVGSSGAVEAERGQAGRVNQSLSALAVGDGNRLRRPFEQNPKQISGRSGRARGRVGRTDQADQQQRRPSASTAATSRRTVTSAPSPRRTATVHVRSSARDDGTIGRSPASCPERPEVPGSRQGGAPRPGPPSSPAGPRPRRSRP